MSMNYQHIVISHLQTERDGVQRDLRRAAISLIANLNSALQDLDAGQRVNSLSLQHASAVSEMIGRWNTYREVSEMLTFNKNPPRR